MIVVVVVEWTKEFVEEVEDVVDFDIDFVVVVVAMKMK